jgi:hypothetical protein
LFIIALTKVFFVTNDDTNIPEFNYKCKNWAQSVVEILTILPEQEKYYFDFGKGPNFLKHHD